MCIVGIDPGKNGGIVVLNKGAIIDQKIMPTIDGRISGKELLDFLSPYDVDVIAIEDVHSIYGTSAKSNFEFGRSLGVAEAIADVVCNKIVRVSPKNWQGKMFDGVDIILKKNKKSKDTKAMAAMAFNKQYPQLGDKFKITPKGNSSKNYHDGLVDAALIALYQNKQEDK